VRARSSPDPFDSFVDYVSARLVEDRTFAGSFAGVAKHYGVAVAICLAQHGNRKGVILRRERHRPASHRSRWAWVVVRDCGHVIALDAARSRCSKA
jgi:hypothetical protein